MRRGRHREHDRYRRRLDLRELLPRILIVCEGEKTEPLYFDRFKPRGARVIVKGTGCNTVSLVEEARRLATGDSFDRVWCVFDRDSFPAEDFQAAIELCKRYGFGAAYTNQAFELWYLLHFDFHTSALDRSQYSDKVTERIGRKYEKNDPALFTLLFPLREAAIHNAERLLTSYNPHVPHLDNPCTTVHQLVRELRELGRI